MQHTISFKWPLYVDNKKWWVLVICVQKMTWPILQNLYNNFSLKCLFSLESNGATTAWIISLRYLHAYSWSERPYWRWIECKEKCSLSYELAIQGPLFAILSSVFIFTSKKAYLNLEKGIIPLLSSNHALIDWPIRWIRLLKQRKFLLMNWVSILV